MRLAIAAILFGFISVSSADEPARKFQIDCRFEKSGAAVGKENGGEWKQYFEGTPFRLVLQTNPTKLVLPAEDDFFWRKPSISRPEEGELRIEWSPKAAPLDRRPQATFTVNQFSGKAVLVWSQTDKTGTGPQYGMWVLRGKCEIQRQKLPDL